MQVFESIIFYNGRQAQKGSNASAQNVTDRQMKKILAAIFKGHHSLLNKFKNLFDFTVEEVLKFDEE